MHNIVKTLPVARFYYKGSHSHPIRRTVLVIDSNSDSIIGYELREGDTLRKASKAPIKTYNRSKIARRNNLRNSSKSKSNKTTLSRFGLMNLIVEGA